MDNRTSRHDLLKRLSADDFKLLGMNRIAYIRPAPGKEDTVMWSLHAADGTLLSIQDKFDMAAFVARSNDLAPVTVH